MISINKKKIKGIVIKTSDYKDNAQIIHLLTEKGLESFICRGAKKVESKMRHLTQEITYVELVVTSNKSLNTITEGEVLENYTAIKDNSDKLLVAMSMLETVNSFKNHIENYETFNIMTQDILNLTQDSTDCRWAFMTPDEVLLSSDFIEIDGRWYSNKRHLQKRTIVKKNGVNYWYYYDDY